VYYKQQLFSFS